MSFHNPGVLFVCHSVSDVPIERGKFTVFTFLPPEHGLSESNLFLYMVLQLSASLTQTVFGGKNNTKIILSRSKKIFTFVNKSYSITRPYLSTTFCNYKITHNINIVLNYIVVIFHNFTS